MRPSITERILLALIIIQATLLIGMLIASAIMCAGYECRG